MVEDRWRRVVGPAMVALALLAARQSAAIADRVGRRLVGSAAVRRRRRPRWSRRPAGRRPRMARRPRPGRAGARPRWRRALAGAAADDRHRTGRAPAGPAARIVRRRPLRTASWSSGPMTGGGPGSGRSTSSRAAPGLADEAAVVRRATIEPGRDDAARDARGPAQRGPTSGSGGGHSTGSRPADPAAHRGRWAVRPDVVDRVRLVGGRRPLAVQSCGAVACRTRLLDPGAAARTSSMNRISDRSSASRAITWSCSGHAAVSPARSSPSTSRATVGPWSAARPAGPH